MSSSSCPLDLALHGRLNMRETPRRPVRPRHGADGAAVHGHRDNRGRLAGAESSACHRLMGLLCECLGDLRPWRIDGRVAKCGRASRGHTFMAGLALVFWWFLG